MLILKDLKDTFLYLKRNYLLNMLAATWLPLVLLFTDSLNYLDVESCKGVSNFNSISVVFFLLLFLLLGCIGLYYFIVGILNKLNRSKNWARSFVCCLGFLFCIPTFRLSNMIRMVAMRKSAILATPIIDAIEEHKIKIGDYPKSLKDLTPKFMTKIPHTGMCAYPRYEYRKSKKPDESGGYELFISTSVGTLNWDEFIYRPSGVYGESFERVGKWAYYHE